MNEPTQQAPDIPGLALRRWTLGVLVALSSLAGGLAMYRVAADFPLAALIPLLSLFTISFTWIVLAFWSGVFGFVISALRLDPLTLKRVPGFLDDPLTQRTALIMPVYAEPPVPTLSGLEATCRSLLEAASRQGIDDLSDHVEAFILSDTQNADQAREEAAHVAALQQRLAGQMTVHYRRREANVGRKAGNIADFCRQWGQNYDTMVVLDADSLMSGEVLLRMMRRMQREPDVGLIQTVPMPVGQRTLFGRFQQYASALYSPMLAAGQSFWQGETANYWGHNAIIRVRAFMACAGLPSLPGKPPLGGEILSHDFVEAALLRRGGWRVLLDTTLTEAHTEAPHCHSFEAMPSNFLDFAKRDRRWLQGNLQHLRLLTASGFHPLSRLHFLLGAMGYLSSLVWLALLVCTSILVGYTEIEEPTVSPLPQPLSLGLFTLTIGLLFAPKLLGWMLAFWQNPEAFGGRLRLTLSTIGEVLFAALCAPLTMAWHSLFIINVLLGRSIEWSTQPRGERSLPWREVWLHTSWLSLCGMAWGAALALLSPTAFVWLTPAWLGLILAAPIVKYSSSPSRGDYATDRLGLLVTPALSHAPALLTHYQALLDKNAHVSDSGIAPNDPPPPRQDDMPAQALKGFKREELAHYRTTAGTFTRAAP